MPASAFDKAQNSGTNEIITATPGVTGNNSEPESGRDATGVMPDNRAIGGGWWGNNNELSQNEIVDISPVYQFGEMYVPEFCWLLAIGENFDSSQMPKYADAWVRNPSNGVGRLELEIQWVLKTFDAPGLQAIEGFVEIPDGYTLRDGVTEKVKFPVLVYDPAQPVAVARVNLHFVEKVVPLGMNAAEVHDYFADNVSNIYFPYIAIELENGSVCNGRIIGMDMDSLDTSTAGTYYPFIIETPPGVACDKHEMPGTELYIREFNEVYLCDFTEHVGGGSIATFWKKIIYEPELWMSIDGGKWEFADFETVSHNFYEDQMTIFLASLPSGHVYEFEVRYENGGVSSDTLIIDLTGDKILCSSGIGGHRSGGHQGENPEPPPSPPIVTDEPETSGESTGPSDDSQKPSDNSQKASGNTSGANAGRKRSSEVSEPDINASGTDHDDDLSLDSSNGKLDQAAETASSISASPSPPALEAVPVSEQNGADFVTLSGKRLAALTENGAAVPFIKNGVQLLIPAEFFQGLKIGEDSLFTVVIQNPGRNVLHLAFYLDGISLTESFAVPFNVFFPYMPEPGEDIGSLVCVDSRGGYVPAHYDNQNSRLSFSLDAGGGYTINPLVQSQSAATVYSPAILTQPAEDTQSGQPQSGHGSKAAWPFVAAGICAPVAGFSIFRGRIRRGRPKA